MRTRSRFLSALLALPVALAACSSDGVPPSNTTPDAAAVDALPVDVALADLVTPVDTAASPDVAQKPDVVAPADTAPTVGPYPAGPYGNRAGNVLANLSWEGYTNLEGTAVSTTLPYGPTSMQAVRETGRAFALVHVSEFF